MRTNVVDSGGVVLSPRAALIPDALYTPRTATRCRGVYLYRRLMRPKYGVKIKALRYLHHEGTFADLPAAVSAVSSWYAERYGPYWQQAVSVRESNPWKVVRGKPNGLYAGRFILIVWLFGKAVILNPPGLTGWSTRRAAQAAARGTITKYLVSQFGLFAFGTPLLWRPASGAIPDAPPGSVWWAPKARRGVSREPKRLRARPAPRSLTPSLFVAGSPLAA
jgi:hypothetical protein